MTSFSRIVKKQIRNQFNKKDGVSPQTSQNLSQFRDPTFEELGFVRTDTGWTYTWAGGKFPVFSLMFGRSGAKWGYTATFGEASEFWPLLAKKGEIKDRLDDMILDIMRHDAELAEAPLDLDQWEREGYAIDFDDFMAVARC